MAKIDQESPQKDDPVGKSDHAAKITAQILNKIGKPTRLHRVEVCQHHNGNYRVNVWETLPPVGDIVMSAPVHIRSSYYLKVSDSGEILHSNPPLTKLRNSA